MTPGERVKELRLKLGLSQKAFGERLGVKDTSITQIELGKNNLTESLLRLISYEFCVSKIWIREGSGDMFFPDPVENLTNEEEELLRIYRAVNGRGKAELLRAACEVNERFCSDNHIVTN